MTTPSDIIIQALKKAGVIGVGQAAQAEDMNDAFDDLNDMMAQWSRKRWLVYHLVDYSIVSTGALFYTVGLGGDINIAERPDRLESAFQRQITQAVPYQTDTPLQIIEARETYNNITLKRLTSFGQYIFYDAAYPLGKIYVWPIPLADNYEIHITIKATLSQFTSLAQVIVLPPEYIAALKWNLAARLIVSYRLPVDNAIVALAKDSLNVIRNANTQIPRLQIAGALTGSGNYYNIYSDNN